MFSDMFLIIFKNNSFVHSMILQALNIRRYRLDIYKIRYIIILDTETSIFSSNSY